MGKNPLAEYKTLYKMEAPPVNFLSGDLDKKEAVLTLQGKRADDLNGAVKRRLLAEINRYFCSRWRELAGGESDL